MSEGTPTLSEIREIMRRGPKIALTNSRLWACPDCGWDCYVTYEELAESGLPYCGCGTEMELEEE